MNKVLCLSALISVPVFILVSCGKKDESPKGDPAPATRSTQGIQPLGDTNKAAAIEEVDKDAHVYRNPSSQWASFRDAPAPMRITLDVPPGWYVGWTTAGPGLPDWSDATTGEPNPKYYRLMLSNTLETDPSLPSRMQFKVVAAALPSAADEYFEKSKQRFLARGDSIVAEEMDYAGCGARVLGVDQTFANRKLRVLLGYVSTTSRLVEIEGATPAAHAEEFERLFRRLLCSVQ